MPATAAPGIHVTEVLRPSLARRVSLEQPSPILVGEAAAGPANAPTLVNSWREFTEVFGGFSFRDDRSPRWLGWGVYQHFQAGGSSVYVIRVVGANATHASVVVRDTSTEPIGPDETQGFSAAFADPGFDNPRHTPESDPGSFVIVALSTGASGNKLSVIISDNPQGGSKFDCVVYAGGILVERWTAMSMSQSDSRYFPEVLASALAGSSYISVIDNATTSFTKPADGIYALAGGADGQAVTTTDIINSVSFINAVDGSVVAAVPGVTDPAVQSALVNYCEQRTDGFAILDAPDDAVNVALTHAHSLPGSSYGALYYPWAVVNDASANRAGATRAVPPSGAIVGMLQRNDQLNGPFAPAAGISAALPSSLGTSQVVTLTQYGALNDAHVNGLRILPGSTAVLLYGVRTLKKGTIDQYIGVRRSLIYIKQSLVNLLQFAVFRNNDPNLWAQVTATCNEFLLSFWQGGGLRGRAAADAYFVVCNGENNPVSSIEAGELHVDVGVALQTPAEFILITVGLWEGGATVEEGTF